MRSINILAGGPRENLPKNFSDFLHSDSDWIGVDAGAFYLLTHGVEHITAIGDFDSLTASELAFVKSKVDPKNFFQAKPEKDYTDTELSLLWVEKHFDLSKYDAINLFAMTGQRLDHELNNLLNLFEAQYTNILRRIKFYDLTNIVEFFAAGNYLLSNKFHKKYLGLITLNDISHFSIKGAKYELSDFSSKIARAFASNEFLGDTEVEISFETGNVIAIYS
ncbi:thiamine diphosphokinase [Oenococcus sicerae]|uniref:thiamine diphosphokinase n=1 Tax=Oenococcus sicerae TaxID=2203724 RepID=UPI0039EAF3D7